jgi:hypothetical protein
MKTLVLFLLISFTSLPLSYSASPTMRCFTGPKSVTVPLKQSAAVFTGEVLEVKDGGIYIEVRLRVERSWKGVEGNEVSLLADRTTESTRYGVGQKYLVFAGKQDGKLFTGNCSRTKKLEYAQGDLEQLEKTKVKRKSRS